MPTDPIGEIPVIITGDDSELQKAINDAVKTAETGAKSIAGAFSAAFSAIGNIASDLGSAAIDAGKGIVHIAEAVAAVSAATIVAAKAMATFGSETATAGGAADTLVDSYRALRLALSPTVFTAASIGVGVLIEETVRAAVATEALIEKQALLAASTNRTFTEINTLANAEKQLGTASGDLTSLFADLSNTGTDVQQRSGVGSLGDIVAIVDQFKELTDPVERAALAVKLFGDNAEKALPLMNDSLKEAISNAYDLNQQLDYGTRESLLRISQTFAGVKDYFKTLENDASYYWDTFKNVGVKALTDLEKELHTFFLQTASDLKDLANSGGLLGPVIRNLLAGQSPLGQAAGVGIGLAGSSMVSPTGMMGAALGIPQNVPSQLEIDTAMQKALPNLTPGAPLEGYTTGFRDLAAAEEAAAEAARRLWTAFSEAGLGVSLSVKQAQQDIALIQKQMDAGTISASQYAQAWINLGTALQQTKQWHVDLIPQGAFDLADAEDQIKKLGSVMTDLPFAHTKDLIAALGREFTDLPDSTIMSENAIKALTVDLGTLEERLQSAQLSAALKRSGFTTDESTGKTDLTKLQDFTTIAGGTQSLSVLEAEWGKISNLINRMAQTDLPNAAKYYQIMLDAAVRLGATTGQQLLLQTQINNAVITAKAQEGIDATAEILANEQLKIKLKLLQDAATATGQIAVDLNKAFDNTFKNLSQGLTDVITGAKGLSDMLSGVLHSFETMFVKSITDAFIKGVQNAFLSTGVQKSITEGVAKLVGGGLSAVGLGTSVAGSAASRASPYPAIPGAVPLDISTPPFLSHGPITMPVDLPPGANIDLGQGAASAGSAASGATGAAGSAASSTLSSVLGIANVAVSALSGIVQGIQGARTNNLLGEIEISTRQTKEQLVGGIQPTLNTYLPELNHMVDLWQAINDVNDILRYGTLNVRIGSTNEITGNNPTATPDTATPEDVSTATKVTLDSVKRLTLSTDSASTAMTDVAVATAPVADAISIITPAIDYTASSLQDLSFSASTLSDTLSHGGSEKLNPIPSANYAPGGPIPLYSSDQIATFTNQYAASLQQAQQALDAQRQASNQLIGTFQQAQIEAGLVGSGVYNGPGGATMGRVPTYMGLTSPGNPSAAFASVADAMAWLQQYTTALSGPTGYQTTQQQRDLTMMRMGSLRSYGAPDINVSGMTSTYQQMLQNQTVGNYGVPVTVNAVDPSGSQITDAIITGLLQKGIRIR